MPLKPLWRPPLELLFVELHEEAPIKHAVSDLGATVRMERFVPYFLEKFKAKEASPGKANTFVLFPDRGAHSRYCSSVVQHLELDFDHLLFIQKTRVGDSIDQVQKLFFEQRQGALGEKTSFKAEDHVLIIDDFTNSGSTLFGAVNLVHKMVEAEGRPSVSIFVSHLVAAYDPKVVLSLKAKVHDLGPQCRFYTTNTIPITTDLLRGDDQIEILDISDFIADLVA
jgi:phosphoribosylpyrophosphate synthetase